MNLAEWFRKARNNPEEYKKENEWLEKSLEVLDEPALQAAYQTACESMGRLNLNGARLLHKYKSLGATDVTGFGILGHAENLAVVQKSGVDIVLERLPVIKGMLGVDKHVMPFNVVKGRSAETSGGLLAMMPDEAAAKAMVAELKEEYKEEAWIVGRLVPGSGKARIAEDVEIIDV